MTTDAAPLATLSFNEIEQRHAEKKAMLSAIQPGTYPHDMEWLLDYARAATERAARLLPYAQHRSTCDHNYGEGDAPCSCGLSAILAESRQP